MKLLITFILYLFSYQEKIEQLPGQTGKSKNLGQSGQITVDKTNNRNLFYQLAESQSNPSSDPLVFWYTGGPGCSGLSASLTENGPFEPDGKGGLTDRKFAWNLKANVVFLEQPAGVGQSYSQNKADYTTDDQKATDDSQAFLKGFIKAQPQFKGRPLWITGESQAGTYITWLAQAIVSDKNSPQQNQLKVLMLGNPVIWCESGGLNSKAQNAIQFNDFYYHSLISQSDFAEWTNNDCDKNQGSDSCLSIFSKAYNKIGLVEQQLKKNKHNMRLQNVGSTKQADLDPDNLYQDFCTGSATLERDLSRDYKECMPQGQQVTAQFNRADVRAAIHATPNNNPFPQKWSTCTDNVNYTVSYKPTTDILRDIFAKKEDLQILYQSGDVDIATVPTPVTQACLHELKDVVKPVKEWSAWTVNGWHTGYQEVFDRYTFLTVKGAGHEVPAQQPEAAYHMYQRFMDGVPFDQNANPIKAIEQTEYTKLREIFNNNK